jgi:hypothetical protein
MSVPFIEPPSESEIENEQGPEHHETNRDKFELAIAHTGSQNVHTTLERETTYEKPVARGDPEKAMQDEASNSPKEVEASSSQDVPDKSSGGVSLDKKDDEDQYPTGIRLLLMTFGLMAVVLMVALDNYILGSLYITPVNLVMY